MSVKARPIEPTDLTSPEEALREAEYKVLDERRKRHEEEYRAIDEKCKRLTKYWKEEGAKARRELQRLQEQRERETVYAQFKPVRPFELSDWRKHSHPVEWRVIVP